MAEAEAGAGSPTADLSVQAPNLAFHHEDEPQVSPPRPDSTRSPPSIRPSIAEEMGLDDATEESRDSLVTEDDFGDLGGLQTTSPRIHDEQPTVTAASVVVSVEDHDELVKAEQGEPLSDPLPASRSSAVGRDSSDDIPGLGRRSKSYSSAVDPSSRRSSDVKNASALFGPQNFGRVNIGGRSAPACYAVISEDQAETTFQSPRPLEERMKAFVQGVGSLPRHPLPRLVVSIGGGHRNDDSGPPIVRMVRQGLRQMAHKVPVWVVTAGTNFGISKIVGDAMADLGVGSTLNSWLVGDAGSGLNTTEIPVIGMCTFRALNPEFFNSLNTDRKLKSTSHLDSLDDSMAIIDLANSWDVREMKHMASDMYEEGNEAVRTVSIVEATSTESHDDDARDTDNLELDPNHTNFFLVESDGRDSFGKPCKFGPELHVWSTFVANMRRTVRKSHDEAIERKWRTIHAVHVMIGGGEAAIHQTAHAVSEGTATLIVEGSGRAADVLAYAWRLLHDSSETARHHTYSELQEMIVRLQIQSVTQSEHLMSWQRYILDIVVDIKRISVWNGVDMDDGEETLSDAVAMTILNSLEPHHVRHSSGMPEWLQSRHHDEILRDGVPAAAIGAYIYHRERLHIARTFNLGKVARSAVTEMRRIVHSASSASEVGKSMLDKDLHRVLLWALSNQLSEFVEMLVPIVKIDSFVFESQRKSNNLASLLQPKNNRTATHLEALCNAFSRGPNATSRLGRIFFEPPQNEMDTDDSPESLNAINQLLGHLLLPGWSVSKDYACVGKCIAPSEHRWQNGGARKVKADRACQDLLVWACICNHHDLAKFFWKYGGNSIATALMAATLLSKLANFHVISTRGSFRKVQLEMQELAAEFEQLAIGTLQTCHADDPDMTKLLLLAKIRHVPGFQRHRAYYTPMALAQTARCLDFMSEPAFLAVVEESWYGVIDPGTPVWRVALATFLWWPLWGPFGPLLFLLIPPASVRIRLKSTEGRSIAIFGEHAVPTSSTKLEKPPGAGGSQNSDDTEAPAAPTSTDVDIGSLFKGYVAFLSAPVVSFGLHWLSSTAVAVMFFIVLFNTGGKNIAPELSNLELVVLAWMSSLAMELFLMWVPDAIDLALGRGGPEEVKQHDLLNKHEQRMRLVPGLAYFGESQENQERTASSGLCSFYLKRALEFQHIMDYFMLFMYAIGTYYRWNASDEPTVESVESYLLISRWCYAWVVIAMFLRLSHFLSVFEFLGPKLFMLELMGLDIAAFLVLWALFTVAYIGAMSSLTFGPPQDNIAQSYMLPMFELFGEAFLDDLNDEVACTKEGRLFRGCPWEQQFIWVFTFVYTFVSTIVLVNLLIAMMSDTYAMVQEKSTQHWHESRFLQLKEHLGTTNFPHPLYPLSWTIDVIFRLRGGCSPKDPAEAVTREPDKAKAPRVSSRVVPIAQQKVPTAQPKLLLASDQRAVDHAPRLLESFQETATDAFTETRERQGNDFDRVEAAIQKKSNQRLLAAQYTTSAISDVMRHVEDISERLEKLERFVDHENESTEIAPHAPLLRVLDHQNHILHRRNDEIRTPADMCTHLRGAYPDSQNRYLAMSSWPSGNIEIQDYRHNFLDSPEGSSVTIVRVHEADTKLELILFKGEYDRNVNSNGMLIDGRYARLSRQRRCRMPTNLVEVDVEEARVHDIHTSHFAGAKKVEVARCAVSETHRDWSVECPFYNPPYFTAPAVVYESNKSNSRAHPEDPRSVPDNGLARSFHPAWTSDDPTGKAAARQVGIPEDNPFHDGVSLYQLPSGTIPLHPQGRTGIRGRGHLFAWGPNRCIDLLLTRWRLSENHTRVERDGKPVLEVLLVQRPTGPWAIPGSLQVKTEAKGKCPIPPALLSKFGLSRTQPTQRVSGLYGHRDDTLRTILENYPKLYYSGVAGDDRDTDNAWLETELYHLHVSNGIRGHFELIDDFSSTRVAWAVAHPYMDLYNGHEHFIREIVLKMKASWSAV